MTCPGCRGSFTLRGLDSHRRNTRLASCRYRPDEPRVGYRPGYLSRPIGVRLTRLAWDR